MTENGVGLLSPVLGLRSFIHGIVHQTCENFLLKCLLYTVSTRDGRWRTESVFCPLSSVRCSDLNRAGVITNERNLLSQKGEACTELVEVMNASHEKTRGGKREMEDGG